jgi:pyridoxine 4-dehydrogenase
LKIDQIPLYQFHRPDPKVPVEESIGAIVALKDEGKIRHIGVCNVSETELHRAQRLTPIVSVQNRYNVADRTSESMVDLCEQERLVFLPWAPILDIENDGPAATIAKAHDCTPRQVVLAWLLARSPSIVPIPGTGTVGHLEENIGAAGIVLDGHEIEALTNAGRA